jgi:hypothetical protein
MKLHLTLFVFLTVLECVCASGYFRDSSFEHFREFLGVETETDNVFRFRKTVIFTDFSAYPSPAEIGNMFPIF